MAGSANIGLNLSAALQGFSFAFGIPAATLAIAGTKRIDDVRDIDTTGGALSTTGLASVGIFAAFVMTGTGGATVTFYRDSGFTLPISSAVAQSQLAVFLINPPTIYAKASAGTVQVRVFAVEQ